MIYGYLRVSTEDQDENSQRIGVEEFCKKHEFKIDKYYIDHGLSGALDFDKRQMGKLMKVLKKGDTVVTSEISRIGRRLVLVLDFIKFCTEKGVNLYTVKDKYKIEDSIQSKVILTVMGLCAEIERDLIRQRTREGLARTRAEGTILGRPLGARTAPEKHKLFGKERFIIELMESGVSKRQIAKICKVNRNTLARYITKKDLKVEAS